jgi:regulator of sirC expression with transglutaminase-like and TPR domain
MNDEKSILALIRLIDDPDEAVFEHVRDRLISYGPEAITYLEESWDVDYYGLIFHARVEELIHSIQFEEIKSKLTSWVNSVDKDLLEGAILVAKYQYPSLDESEIERFIQQVCRDIWLELNSKQTAFEQVKIFNNIFFNLYEFQGATAQYYSPLNSFINTVIESRKGNPLSLCLLYSIVAQRLELPIYGVNLPNHFILAYLDKNGASIFLPEKNEFGVLFYLNPFSKGSILDAKSIREFLDGSNLPHTRSYFEPCSNTAIIRRMITNLIASFQEVGNASKVNELIALRELVS